MRDIYEQRGGFRERKTSDEILLPNRTKNFDTLSLSRMRVNKWIADISKDFESQLSKIFNKCVNHSLNVYELTDIIIF